MKSVRVICDRCKDSREANSGTFPFAEIVMTSGPDKFVADLCNKCKSYFFEWIKINPETKSEPEIEFKE